MRTPDQLRRATAAIQKALATKQVNVAVGLMLALADDHVGGELLADIDRASYHRGHILSEEAIRREQLAQRAIRMLGFDPRTATPAQVPFSLPPPEPFPVLGDGEPIRWNGWRQLWEAVERREISELEAKRLGAKWKGLGE